MSLERILQLTEDSANNLIDYIDTKFLEHGAPAKRLFGLENGT